MAAAAVLATGSAGLVVAGGPAVAADFTVTNGNDAGAGSLRQALIDAAVGGPHTVTVQGGVALITLSSPIAFCAPGVTIDGNGVTITAPGAGIALLDDCGAGFTARELTVSGVTGSQAGEDNAPIVSQGGSITLSDCTIQNNSVAFAAGQDEVSGGVLSEGGPLSITNCTISGNTATSTGGGRVAGAVASEGGALTIVDSTITNNTALATVSGPHAGAITNWGGPSLTISGSTISGNRSTATGDSSAGTVISSGRTGSITSTAITDNTATSTATTFLVSMSAGVLWQAGGSIAGTTIARNHGSADYDGDLNWDAAGGIMVDATLAMTGSTIECNTFASLGTGDAQVAGGIHNASTATLTDSRINANTATGTGAQDNTSGTAMTLVNTPVTTDAAACQVPVPTTTTPPTTAGAATTVTAAQPVVVAPQFTG